MNMKMNRRLDTVAMNQVLNLLQEKPKYAIGEAESPTTTTTATSIDDDSDDDELHYSYEN